MNITEAHPREPYTIAGKTFQIPRPYAEGHTLTAGEAHSLNQTLAENVRNNLAKQIKAHDEAGTFDQTAMQSKLNDYLSSYEFGVRTASGVATPRDPVGARALKLAKDAVRRSIVKNGGNVKDYGNDAITERAAKAVESNPKFRATAQAQIEAESSLADDDGGMDSPPAPAQGKAKAARAA